MPVRRPRITGKRLRTQVRWLPWATPEKTTVALHYARNPSFPSVAHCDKLRVAAHPRNAVPDVTSGHPSAVHGARHSPSSEVQQRHDEAAGDHDSLLTKNTRGGLSGFLIAFLIVLVLYGYWWSMLRWLIFQNDDIGHGSNYGPEGSFEFLGWLQSWWRDYTIRNGRSADVIVRLLVAPGIDAARLLVPAVLAAACTAAWRFVEPTRPRFLYGVWLAAAALLLPTVVALAPEVAGGTVLWTAGVANYVVPTAVAMYAASWFFRPPDSGAAAILAVVSIVAASLLHEQSAVAALGIAIVALLFGRGRESPIVKFLVVVCVLGFVVKVTAPGLHSRREVIGSRRELEGFPLLERNAMVGGTGLVDSIDILWVVLLVSLTVATLTLTQTTKRQVRWVGATMVASWTLTVLLFVITRRWNVVRGEASRTDPLLPDQRMTGYAALALAVLALLAVAIWLVQLDRRWGLGPLLAYTGFISSAAVLVASGVGATRAELPLYWWLALAILLVLLQASTSWSGDVPAASAGMLMATACLALSANYAVGAQAPLAANSEAMQEVLDQVPEAQRGERGAISMPRHLPFPEYAKKPTLRLDRVGCYLRRYYGVPKDVVLDNGTNSRARFSEYCRGDG